MESRIRYEVGGAPEEGARRKLGTLYEDIRRVVLALPIKPNGETPWVQFFFAEKRQAYLAGQCVRTRSDKGSAFHKTLITQNRTTRTAIRKQGNRWILWIKVISREENR